mmetsp:Transcript_12956/g.29369  ORF Transcript_12956/g.29369 Transcript_12956/m.29369 type:complete len:414 (-) Transcript_12956:113-1354(-)
MMAVDCAQNACFVLAPERMAVAARPVTALPGYGREPSNQGRIGTAAVLFGCATAMAMHSNSLKRRTHGARTSCQATEMALKADEALQVTRGKARDRREGQTIRSDEELAKYKIVYAAEDAAEWQPAQLLSSETLPNGDRLVTVEIEASRQLVPLKNAYRMPGQRMKLRLSGEQDHCSLPVATPPPSLTDNHEQLLNLKGDIYAGSTKCAVKVATTKVKLEALLAKDSPLDVALENATLPLEVEAGPFDGFGLNVLPLAPVFRTRAILFLCEESCSATCSLRALIDSQDSASDLQLWHRDAVCLVQFAAGNAAVTSTCAELIDNDRLDSWEENHKVRSFRALGGFDGSVTELISNFLQVRGVESISAGALVLGSPEFTKIAIQELCETVGLPRSQVVCGMEEAGFARVVDPEQI